MTTANTQKLIANAQKHHLTLSEIRPPYELCTIRDSKGDGTKRNGYAEDLCQVLKDNNVSNVKVKVVKFGSRKDPKRDNAYGILLG